jgi:hypothetical protein
MTYRVMRLTALLSLGGVEFSGDAARGSDHRVHWRPTAAIDRVSESDRRSRRLPVTLLIRADEFCIGKYMAFHR